MSSPATYLFSFLVVCFVCSLVMNGARLRSPDAILKETWRLFVTITVGIGIFSAVVWVLEWIMIRPLL